MRSHPSQANPRTDRHPRLSPSLGAFGDSGTASSDASPKSTCRTPALAEVRKVLRPQEAGGCHRLARHDQEPALRGRRHTALPAGASGPRHVSLHERRVPGAALRLVAARRAHDRTSSRSCASARASSAAPRRRSRRAKPSGCSPISSATCTSRCTLATPSSTRRALSASCCRKARPAGGALPAATRPSRAPGSLQPPLLLGHAHREPTGAPPRGARGGEGPVEAPHPVARASAPTTSSPARRGRHG